MAIITIKIDERMKAGRVFLDFIKTLPFVTIQEEESKQFNAETEKVISDAKKGIDVTTVKSAKALFEELGI
jgi:antitoxin component of RelBE/YafQ-DinJ toxin-antitoxin module